MKKTAIGFETFEEDFHADLNTMYVKTKNPDLEKYTQITKPSTENKEEFLKMKEPLVKASWERYVAKINQLEEIGA